MEFPVGNVVTYEFRSSNSGIKYTCSVVGASDGWILDVNHGTNLSSSFRPEDVFIWENKKEKKQ